MYQRPSPKNASGHYKVAIGHVVSRDLVSWARLPVAIWPDHPYDSQDIFTGSTTVVGQTPFLVYPGKSQHSMAISMAVRESPAACLCPRRPSDRTCSAKSGGGVSQRLTLLIRCTPTGRRTEPPASTSHATPSSKAPLTTPPQPGGRGMASGVC